MSDRKKRIFIFLAVTICLKAPICIDMINNTKDADYYISLGYVVSVGNDKYNVEVIDDYFNSNPAIGSSIKMVEFFDDFGPVFSKISKKNGYYVIQKDLHNDIFWWNRADRTETYKNMVILENDISINYILLDNESYEYGDDIDRMYGCLSVYF